MHTRKFICLEMKKAQLVYHTLRRLDSSTQLMKRNMDYSRFSARLSCNYVLALFSLRMMHLRASLPGNIRIT